MHRGWQVIWTIFAGRRDRLKLQFRYLEALHKRGLIDEVHCWDYTRDATDLAWLQSIGAPLLYTAPHTGWVYPCQFLGQHHLVVEASWVVLEVVTETEVFYVDVNQDRLVLSRGTEIVGECTETRLEACNSITITQTALRVNNAYVDLHLPSIQAVRHKSRCNAVWSFNKPSLYRYCLPQPHAANNYRSYYQHYTEGRYAKSIIVKCDDDIGYIDVDRFQDFLDIRIDNPDAFLVLPSIVNNGVCAFIQQHRLDCIPAHVVGELEMPPGGCGGSLWSSKDKCMQLHRYFADHVAKFTYDRLIALPPELRISINLFAVLPHHLRYLSTVQHDDEHELSVALCVRHNLQKLVCCSLVVSHLTFGPQEKGMSDDEVNELLNMYNRLADLNMLSSAC